MTQASHETPPKAERRISTAIRMLMAARHTSGPELAEKLGRSDAALYDRLNGKTRLSVDETEAIAVALGTDLAGLVGLADSEWGVRSGWLPPPANALTRAIERLQPTQDADFLYTGRTNELVAV